jgi:hypothetical protein
MQTESAIYPTGQRVAPAASLLSPGDVAREYGIPETTQAVWRCTNRYDFRGLVIKLGASVRYKRTDLEAWIETRRVSGAEVA